MSDLKRDNNLLERIKRDPEEFVEVYNTYYLDVLNFMYFRVSHKQIAEDLTSDVFHRAFKNIFLLRKLKYSLCAWLYTIARNRLYSYYRKNKSVQLEHEELISDERENVFDELVRSEKEEECSVQVKRIRSIVRCMPQKLHEVFTLYYYEQLSVRDISDRLLLSVSNVKTCLHRGREYVRKNYEG